VGDDGNSVPDLLDTVLHPVAPGGVGTPDIDTASEREEPIEVDAVAFVYVPIRPKRTGDDPDTATFELRMLDGQPGLAVYTSRERLVAELGRYQPHVRIPVLRLLVSLANETFPIVVNPALEPGAETWTEQSIRAWRSS
jgi:hypothetical protein